MPLFSVEEKLRKHTGMIKMKGKPKGGGLMDVIVPQSYNTFFSIQKGQIATILKYCKLICIRINYRPGVKINS